MKNVKDFSEVEIKTNSLKELVRKKSKGQDQNSEKSRQNQGGKEARVQPEEPVSDDNDEYVLQEKWHPSMKVVSEPLNILNKSEV